MKLLLALGALVLGSACGERAAAPTPTAPQAKVAPIPPMEASRSRGPCADLDYCACTANPACQAELTETGCMCPCDFACTAPQAGCMCACGGKRFLRCEPSAPSAKAAPTADVPPPAVPSTVEEVEGPLPACDEARTQVPCIFRVKAACYVFAGPKQSATPVDCPKPPPPPGGDACARTAQCVGVSDEGCCVGCNHPMLTRIAPSCAKAIEAAKGCDAVRRLARSKACVMH
ncbi:MAG: hypothetical protein HOO96_21130 [Polyangiaceae bacterium]|nr:hypothetical protein [Polyangiaceae bacterium]